MRLLIALSLLCFGGCRGEDPSSSIVENSVDSSLPGPQRAAAAAARVTPLLQPDLEKAKLKLGDPVFIRAFKHEEVLELWMRPQGASDFKLFRSYPVAAASGKLGPKTAEGDRQVPEGFYHFGRNQLKPDSRYHLAFNIGYPNAYDRHHGRTGSFIMVHGNRVSIGCLAMTDPKIEEIYTLCAAALDGGQPFIRIHLFPFRMTPEAMAKRSGHRHLDFWKNLKAGYDHFERDHTPPETTISAGVYQFEQDQGGAD